MTIKNLIIDAIQDSPGISGEEIIVIVKRKNPDYKAESVTRELRRLKGEEIMNIGGDRYYINRIKDKRQKTLGEWE